MEMNQNRTDFTALENIAAIMRKSNFNDIDDVYFAIEYIANEVQQTGRDCGVEYSSTIFSLFS